MEEQHTGNPIIVTQSSTRSRFGIVKDSSQILRDLVKPPLSPETWNVLQRAEAWKQFMESQPLDTPGLPEKALHRDTMYYE